MPLTYERAFGGIDDTDPDACPTPTCPTRSAAAGPGALGRAPDRPAAAQHRGAGRARERRPGATTGRWASAIRARNWPPRYSYAGTYDQHWIDEVFPFLPADFDDRYYQAAPEDQWIDEPQGGEEVVLVNLTPRGPHAASACRRTTCRSCSSARTAAARSAGRCSTRS